MVLNKKNSNKLILELLGATFVFQQSKIGNEPIERPHLSVAF